MKTVLVSHLSIVILLCLVDSMRDPAYAGAQTEIAVKAGPDISTTTDDSTLDLHSRYGFSGGLAGCLLWPVIERFSLAGQLELLYTPRGMRLTSESGGEDVAKLRYHYLDITLAARPAARLGPTRVYLLLGAGLNFLMSATIEDAAGMKRSTTDGLHRVDVALLAGAGVALHLSRGEVGPFRLSTVFLEGRHDHGLLDTDAVNGGFKNRASSLMLGVSLALSSGE